MINDPYQVLGISPDAAPEEIKRAYRQKAKEFHPDLHPGDAAAAQKMNEVNEAYDMLQNPEKYRASQEQEAAWEQNAWEQSAWEYVCRQKTAGAGQSRVPASPFGMLGRVILGVIGFRLLMLLMRFLTFGFGMGFAY